MEEYTCIGCSHLVELFKHPSNNNVFKGAIDESTGLYACLIFQKMEEKGAIVFDKKDAGGCEMQDTNHSTLFIIDGKRIKELFSMFPTVDEQVKSIKIKSDLVQLKNHYVRILRYEDAAKLRDAEQKLK